MTEPTNASSAFELISGNSDISEWVKNNHDYVVKKFRQHGAILFRGFTGELESFIQLTDLFCNGYMYNTIYSANARQDISRQLKIQTVDLSGDYFPLHAERGHTPFRADIAFFHCRHAPENGGETFFCDGALLVEKFSEKLRAFLLKQRFRYFKIVSPIEVMNFLDIADEKLLPQVLEKTGLDQVYFFNDGQLVINYLAPVIHKSKFSDKLAFANFLLFSRYGLDEHRYPTFAIGSEISQSLCDEINHLADELTTTVQWENNDYLMLDNTRVMHGRNEVDPNMTREIWTRFGYANFQ